MVSQHYTLFPSSSALRPTRPKPYTFPFSPTVCPALRSLDVSSSTSHLRTGRFELHEPVIDSDLELEEMLKCWKPDLWDGRWAIMSKRSGVSHGPKLELTIYFLCSYPNGLVFSKQVVEDVLRVNGVGEGVDFTYTPWHGTQDSRCPLIELGGVQSGLIVGAERKGVCIRVCLAELK